MRTTNLLGRLALASAVFTGALGFGAASSASASGPPFTDQYQTGLITLCNQQGQVVKSGSTLSVPFAWYAVSSSPAPSGYGKGMAQLAAYQPIQYEDPSDWEGQYLSVGSWYSDPNHPIAAATNRDTPLVYFVQDHPLHWDGLVELRMFYSALGKEFLSTSYPIAIIKVDGNNWKLIEGGSGPCDAGTSKTMESQVTPAAELDTPQTVVLGTAKGKGTSTTKPGSRSSGSNRGSKSTTTRPSGAAGPGARGTAGSGPGGTAGPNASGTGGIGNGGQVASGAEAGAASLSGHHSSDGGPITAAIAAVVVALLAGAGLYSRRRLTSRRA